MKRLWALLGNTIFWASWPALWVYLRIGRRTRVLLVAEGKILLVKGWYGAGDWLLPGGGLHRGEEPVHGAVRELYEETGIQLDSSQLQHLFSRKTGRRGLSYTYDCFVAELPKIVQPKNQKIEIIESAWLLPEEVVSSDSEDEINQALQAWLHR